MEFHCNFISSNGCGSQEWHGPLRNSILVECPWCHSSSTTLRYHLVGGNIYTCTFCGIGFVHPLPSKEALSEYYNDDYHFSLEKYLPAYRRRAYRKFNELCKRVEQKIKPGRLLEIGSSYGFFLDVARSRGWEIMGIELDAQACSFCQKVMDLKVYCGTLEQFTTEKQFDMICMWHTLEHDSDCFITLRRVKDLLVENGLLVLTLPNVGSLASRFNGRHWEWAIPPAHIFYFNPGAIRQVLSDLGFREIETFTQRGDARNLIMEALVGFLKRTPLSRWARTICTQPISDSSGNQGKDYVNRLHPAYRLVETSTATVSWFLWPAFILLNHLGLGEEILLFARNRCLKKK